LKIQNEVIAKLHEDNKQHVTAEHERTRAEIIKAVKEARNVGDISSRNALSINDTKTHDAQMQRIQLEDAILDSLGFPYMDTRYHGIEDAHKKTFNWIYQPVGSETKPWYGFTEWLAYGDGIYWINGKAGSGKSTLMRYIYDDSRTSSLLNKWAGPSADLIMAGFFFWKSGVPEQASQVGLLRSLLHTLLSRRREAIPEIFSEEWDKIKCRIQTGFPSWSYEQRDLSWHPKKLERSLKRFFELMVGSRICLFIDGLDEYNGDPADTIRLFKDIASPEVKICLSSRPWVEFHQAFKGLPSLRLQDLTFDDIRLYVNDVLASDERFLALSEENPIQASTLVTEIVKKADGVFLWVKLVVKSLLEGLTCGDSITELRSRLAELPSDLAKLYAYMLDAIKPRHRVEGSKYFEMMRAWHTFRMLPSFVTVRQNLRALVLSFALEDESGTLTNSHPRISTQIEMKRLVDRIDKRLKVCCAGLLEFLDVDCTEVYEDREIAAGNPQVWYIHRTASDFLDGEYASNKISEATSNINFRTYGALLRGFTLQLNSFLPSTARSYHGYCRLVATILNLAYHAEAENIPPTIQELDEGLMVLSHFRHTKEFSVGSYDTLRREWLADNLILAVRASLFRYLSVKLDLPSQVPIPRSPCGRSYLYYALESNFLSSTISSERVIAFLLPHSSHSDIKEGWEMALEKAGEHFPKNAPPKSLDLPANQVDESKMWLAILKLFLEYGASTTEKVKMKPGSTWSMTEFLAPLGDVYPDEVAQILVSLTRGRAWRHRFGLSKLSTLTVRPKMDWDQYPERTWWKMED
jgi:hypothetical protein